jgi:TPR repeat protein
MWLVMPRFAPRLLGIILPIVLIHSTCLAFPFIGQKPAPKKDKSASKYEKLAKKAEAGDVDAAKALAKWCYVHDSDTERAQHWLMVAAQHGDASSAKITGYLDTSR